MIILNLENSSFILFFLEKNQRWNMDGRWPAKTPLGKCISKIWAGVWLDSFSWFSALHNFAPTWLISGVFSTHVVRSSGPVVGKGSLAQPACHQLWLLSWFRARAVCVHVWCVHCACLCACVCVHTWREAWGLREIPWEFYKEGPCSWIGPGWA